MRKKFGNIKIGTVFKLFKSSPDSLWFKKTKKNEAEHTEGLFGIVLDKNFIVTIKPLN